MKRFIVISILIIIAGIGVLYISLTSPDSQTKISTIENSNFCGTNAFTSETSTEGKKLFNANCAACHKLDKKMTGPALRGVSQKYDTLTITKFLYGEKTEIVNNDYQNKCINFPQLTTEDISHLLSYTN